MDEAQVAGWHGREVFDRDGAKIGKLEDAFLDARTGRPAWATVSAGILGRRHHFVPLIGAREVDDGIAVPVDGRLVGDAPNVDRDGDLSVEDEHRLYEHYGIDDGIGAGAAGASGRDRAPDGHDGRSHDEHDRDRGTGGHVGPHDDHDRGDHDRDAAPHADRGEDHDHELRPGRGGEGDRDAADASAPVTGGLGGAAGGTSRSTGDATGSADGRTTSSDVLREQQAAAATAAAERAAHEQQAAALAERDRLAAGGAGAAGGAVGSGGPAARHDGDTAGGARSREAGGSGAGGHHDGPADPQDVLPQTDASGDLDAAPSDHLTGATDHGAPVPDARFVGRPHVDDDHHVVPDRIIDPSGGTDDGSRGAGAGAAPTDDRRGDATAGNGGLDGTDAPRTPADASDRPTMARPGVGTRLRRLARAITPTKDDHHG